MAYPYFCVVFVLFLNCYDRRGGVSLPVNC